MSDTYKPTPRYTVESRPVFWQPATRGGGIPPYTMAYSILDNETGHPVDGGMARESAYTLAARLNATKEQ